MAPDVGGWLSGCTNVVPVVTFWQNLVYRKESRLSSDLQLYWHNNAFSPAIMTSSLEAPVWLKTLACSRNSTSVLIFVSATPLPIPWILEVVLHPRMAVRTKYSHIHLRLVRSWSSLYSKSSLSSTFALAQV